MPDDDHEGDWKVQIISKGQAEKEIHEANDRHKVLIRELLSIPPDGVTEVSIDDWALLRVKVASKSDLFDPATEKSPVFNIHKDEANGAFYLQRVDEE